MNSSSLIFGAFVSRTSLTAKVYAVTLSLLVAFMPFAGVFVPVSVAEAASPGDVIINEVMPNPIGSDATGEYVQLKNETAGTVNLNNWTLDIDGTTFTLPNTGGSFASGNTYNICRDASASSTAAVSCDTEMTSMSLHNSNAVRIELRDQSDKLIDLFEYNNGGGSIGDDEKPVNEYEGTLEGDHMITICHWDDEESTYNQITVDTNGLNGHGIHGDDIIPPFGDDEFENGQNWDDDGQAIYNNDCGNYEEEEEEEEEIEQCTEASQRWADSVVSFNQGNQNGGASVLGDRSDETKAVGPEDIEDRGEGDPSTIDYVSLGFGGSIILKFDQAIPDRAGDDLRIYETSYPLDPTSPAVNSYKERAEVWASATGTSPSDFKFLGEVTLDTVGDANTVNTVDLAVGGLSEARYVKIVDVSNPNHFNDSADGFDVAGVEGLTCGNDDPDPENDHALSLSGHKFNNLNGDRDQDDGEENLGAGWVFNLYLEDELGDWQHIDQATTTESGVFQFTPQLQDAGTYHICEVLQDGWSQVKQDWSGTPYHIVTDNESSNSDEGPWCRTIVYTDEADRSNKSYFGNQQISDDYTHQECAVPQTGDVEEDAEVLDAPSGEDDLQEILDDNYSGIDVNDDSTGYQTWSGENQTLTFNITLLATEADSTNTFGYYTNGDTSTFTPLFVSTIGDGHTKSVSIPLVGSTDVGFAIENNEGIWPTEIGAGDFPGDHAVTYHVGDGTYVIGFEDSNKYDDDDFNDVVVEIEVTSCHGHLECAIPGLENDDDAEVLNAPSGEDDLQEILDAESYVVDVNDDSTGYQFWSGEDQTLTFEVTLLATQAGLTNTFGYYTNGNTGSFVPLFTSATSTGHTETVEVTMVGPTDVSFAIQNNEGLWSTTIADNSDEEDHAVTYHVGSATYVIGFDDSNEYNDDDYNDVVVKITMTDCEELEGPEPDTFSISGMKWHDENRDGIQDNDEDGLEGWTIVAKPQSLVAKEILEIDSSDEIGETTSLVLDSSRLYLIEVEGDYRFRSDSNDRADAEYYTENNWTSHGEWGQDNLPEDQRTLDMVIDNTNIDWQSFNNAHLYKHIMEGTGNTAVFRIFERQSSHYNDNEGELTVRIYDVTDYFTVTDSDGNYEFTDLEEDTYQVVEMNQDGWVQTYPTDPSYYHFVLTEDTSGLDFGNDRIGEILGSIQCDAGIVHLDIETEDENGKTFRVDPITGDATLINTYPGKYYGVLTAVPGTDDFYAIRKSDNMLVILKDDGSIEEKGANDKLEHAVAMEFGKNSLLYVLDQETNKIYEIDPLNGTVFPLGSISGSEGLLNVHGGDVAAHTDENNSGDELIYVHADGTVYSIDVSGGVGNVTYEVIGDLDADGHITSLALVGDTYYALDRLTSNATDGKMYSFTINTITNDVEGIVEVGQAGPYQYGDGTCSGAGEDIVLDQDNGDHDDGDNGGNGGSGGNQNNQNNSNGGGGNITGGLVGGLGGFNTQEGDVAGTSTPQVLGLAHTGNGGHASTTLATIVMVLMSLMVSIGIVVSARKAYVQA